MCSKIWCIIIKDLTHYVEQPNNTASVETDTAEVTAPAGLVAVIDSASAGTGVESADVPATAGVETNTAKKKKRSGRRRRRRRRRRTSTSGAAALNSPSRQCPDVLSPEKKQQHMRNVSTHNRVKSSSAATAAPHTEVPASSPSSPTRRRPGHRGGRRRRRRVKTPTPADPVSTIPAAASPPPPPVAPCAQVVVSALILFNPATGCTHWFTVTSDGAFHPSVRLYPVCPGIPSGVTACV